MSYLIGVFIFATIVGQVGNVITNRNANRLEFERLLDGAKTYMRHHKVPGGMKRRVLRWYDYSWSRGRIQGGGDINTALGLLPDKLKTELALHVNLSVLKKVTIFQVRSCRIWFQISVIFCLDGELNYVKLCLLFIVCRLLIYRIIVLKHFSFSYYIKKLLLVLIFSHSSLHVVENIIDLNL